MKKMGIDTEFTVAMTLPWTEKDLGYCPIDQRGRLLHHGTLLFHSKLDTISDVLRVKADKIESKGIKSVAQPGDQYGDYFPDVSIDDFKEQFYKDMHAEKGLERYVFNEDDVTVIKKLREKKYATWEWNYGHSPEYNIKKDRHFDSGNLSIYMDVERGDHQHYSYLRGLLWGWRDCRS
jgi:lipoate-protein ligase A